MTADYGKAAGTASPALAEALDSGCASLGIVLAAETRRLLLDYVALLVKWNATYNLTAVRDPHDMLVQHVLDSLAIVRPLAECIAPANAGRGVDVPRGTTLADIGSGAGLPGLILALVWPQSTVTLVEPVGKKSAFLRQCVGALGLSNVRVVADRVQSIAQPQDIVVCRAYASLRDFVTTSARLIDARTIVAAMKGVRPDDELAELPPDIVCREIVPLEVPMLAAERHLVILQRRRADSAPASTAIDLQDH